MYKTIILSSIFAVLSVGNAAAFDAAWGFGPSDENDQPIPRFQVGESVDRSAVTSGVTNTRESYGYATGAAMNLSEGTGRTVKFSAAQGFGPSDEDDLPAPRFQIAR
ncbi:hypothetical protein [Chelativorans salis]|uniref:Uncharacterized protein n=1 Tax=Chelativorans salis TaxID=2978478 RepID=A0ABT2LIM4_9HYPH|nr:hypothetical protein [Chelativorans sp. EGI FJ00035]MCT7374169.1 hypothetical protein [Chelativorans sp. EGI FJ00035]